MAQSTIELRHLLETTDIDGKPFALFDFPYQFDDLVYKAEIERAVIDYYYFAEIGQESPDRFKHVFKRRWLEVIAYYNKIHNIDLIEFDPLVTYRMSESYEATGKAEQLSKTNAANSSTQKAQGYDTSDTDISDYPQSAIGGDYQNGRTETKAASSGTTDARGDAYQNTTTADTRDDTYTKTMEGFTGRGYNGVDVIKNYMDNTVNLLPQIIEEMKPCFMLTY